MLWWRNFLRNIKKNFIEAGIYSIIFIFDETTDIAHQSKIIIFECAYLHGSEVRDFIEFINIIEEVTKSTKYNVKATSQELVVTGQNNGNVPQTDLLKHNWISFWKITSYDAKTRNNCFSKNNCFRSEKRSTTLRQAKTGKHEFPNNQTQKNKWNFIDVNFTCFWHFICTESYNKSP